SAASRVFTFPGVGYLTKKRSAQFAGKPPGYAARETRSNLQLKAQTMRLLCASMPRREENQMLSEVVGLVLLGLGTLLFLALISYKPKDVPEWMPIISHNAPANHPAQNFIGPLGAIVAGIFYFLFGAA